MTGTERPPEEPDEPDVEQDTADEVDRLQRQFDIAHDSPPAPDPREA